MTSKYRAETNPAPILSKYKATGPDGDFRGVVQLPNNRKMRLEKAGWTFERTTLPLS
jgi:hypothetical protein